MRSFSALLRGTVDLLVPPTCWMCGQPAPDGATAFCPACEASLTQDPDPVCPRCASTLAPASARVGVCPRCLNENFSFEAVIRLGPYAGLLRDAILRMKHHEAFAEAMATLAASHLRHRLQGHVAKAIIPVPLHWRRRMGRGYNQSEILARALAVELGLPLSVRALRRTRLTVPQTETDDRRRNVRGVFAPRSAEAWSGCTVYLVDDVSTTGATAHEAARALQTRGVRTVVIVLAHEAPRK